MGRLKQFVQEGFIELKDVSYVVLDEADRMLDQPFDMPHYELDGTPKSNGFREDVKWLFTHQDMPPKEERVTLMFRCAFLTWNSAI